MFPVERPIKQLLNTMMLVSDAGVIFKTPKKSHQAFFSEKFARLKLGSKPPEFYVLLQRIGREQWCMVHHGKWTEGLKAPSCIVADSVYFACWGIRRTSKRLVMQVYSHTWMVFDKYGGYASGTPGQHWPQASGPPVAVQSAAAAYVGSSTHGRPHSAPRVFDDPEYKIQEEENLIWYAARI